MKPLLDLLIVILGILVGLTAAEAGTLRAGWIVCQTKQSFDEMTQVRLRHDLRGAAYLIHDQKVCFFTAEEIQASVLEAAPAGWVKVRTYNARISEAGRLTQGPVAIPRRMMLLWTVAEAVQP